MEMLQPLHIEYSASNGESGSAEQTSDGSWTIEADAYGEIEVTSRMNLERKQ